MADYFSEIDDTRRTTFAYRHDLVETLVILTCARFSGLDCFEGVARWAKVKCAWLLHFRTLKNCIRSADTLGRVARLVEPIAFKLAFRAWVGSVLPTFSQGACLRSSGSGQRAPEHLVSAYASNIGFAFGQEGVAAIGDHEHLKAIRRVVA